MVKKKNVTHQKVRAILKKEGFGVGGWGKTSRCGCAGYHGDLLVGHKHGLKSTGIVEVRKTEYAHDKELLQNIKKKLRTKYPDWYVKHNKKERSIFINKEKW